jgi:hypothetical protein
VSAARHQPLGSRRPLEVLEHSAPRLGMRIIPKHHLN